MRFLEAIILYFVLDFKSIFEPFRQFETFCDSHEGSAETRKNELFAGYKMTPYI